MVARGRGGGKEDGRRGRVWESRDQEQSVAPSWHHLGLLFRSLGAARGTRMAECLEWQRE